MQKVHATATIPQYMIYNFSIAELVKCFSCFSVELKGIKFTETALALKIHGTQMDIRLAVKALYTLINQQFKRLAQIETEVAKEIPEELKNYGKDNGQYKKQYDAITGEYLKHCMQNNIQPHPEVIDGYVF